MSSIVLASTTARPQIKLPPVWTDERIERLKELYRDEASYTMEQIADRLGAGLTRNAVIGKCTRLGLERRPPVLSDSPRAERSRLRQKGIIDVNGKPMETKKGGFGYNFRTPDPELSDLPADQSPDAVTLMDLLPEACRWPISEDPRKPDFMYCGSTRLEGYAYCKRHKDISVQPGTAWGSQRRRDRNSRFLSSWVQTKEGGESLDDVVLK